MLNLNYELTSPLKRLRELYPDEDWRAVKEGFNWEYYNNKGEHAGYRSCMTYDSWDDEYERIFFIYRNNKKVEYMSI